MIGLDTNILVRIIANDDAKQVAKIKAAFAKAGDDELYFVNNITLVEMVWVLDNVYDYDSQAIIASLEIILNSDKFVFENREVLEKAIGSLRLHKLEFADLMIALCNSYFDCKSTYTFDKKAAKLKEFELL